MEESLQKETAKSETSSTDNDKKKEDEMVSVGELFSFARTAKSKLCIVGAFFFACISGACFPAVAFYFASAFEDLAADATSSGFMATIRELAYTFMILGVILLSSMTIQAFLMETAATEMTMALKTDWFRALLRQDIQYYDIMDVSGEATIITTNANKFRKGVGRKSAEAVQYAITFLGGFGYAFYASWEVSLAVLAIVPFLTASTLFLLKMNTSVTSRANASYAKAGSIVSTSVSSIRTILALNAVDIMIERFKEATKEAFDGAVSQVGWLGLANGCNLSSMLLSYVIITLFGSWLLYNAVKSDGCDPSGAVEGNDACEPEAQDIIGALFGVSFGAAVLPQVSVAIEALTGARVACWPAFAVIRRTVDNETKKSDHEVSVRRGASMLPEYVIDSSSESGIKPDIVHGQIEFKNVFFHYPTRRENGVFRDFSLTLEAGKTVALVGFSGSGKSTAVQLIERFYDPTAGSITLDGNDLKSLNIKWLRQQLALVQQEPKLFECSIRQNIALGAPEATDEQIETAARMANAHDFILEFPKGYDTEVGALGDQLSGGQRQRICIARCLVKDPKILLLDEATSALDSESERIVQAALDNLIKLKKMTTFVIAHRLSTIKNADVIAVVNEGQIVESGTHQELLAKEDYYFRLVQAQEAKTSAAQDGTPSASEHGSAVDEPSAHDEQVRDALIEFEDVFFEYPSRPNAAVCRGLNLKVRQGETLALVGPSGCGKSTVIQLMECFYRPTEGVVKYKGVDMKDLNVRWLRDQLGLVSQQPTLFDCSIEENIRYGLSKASHEEVVEAAKQANAHDFIMEFPEGYATSVGAGSTLVSGGQKQRICIARALVKKPKVLLLDEATSALDSESEKVVQEALDKIMFDKDQTCVVIAHRLSTIHSADRIAVIEHGKVRELGTHNELMALPDGRYRRLQDLQSLDAGPTDLAAASSIKKSQRKDNELRVKEGKTIDKAEDMEIDENIAKANAKRARLLASGDNFYFVAGGLGAFFAGLVFPGWGFLFAYMIEILYTPVVDCRSSPVEGFADCEDYWSEIADDMQQRSLKVFYGYLGIIASAMIGFTLLFWGFGIASERMNKRVRDAAFTSLLRQEVAWYDLRSPGALTSRLSDDAALLHAFSGEPIRSFVSSLSSVLVGVVVSFVYMWPFALLSLGILPFMAFGAEMEMTMYYGEDEGDDEDMDANSPGGVVIESLSNIRTVASLTLEEDRAEQYVHALEHENPHPNRTNIAKGGAAGVGQFVQMWGTAMMFWWGGWLLANYSGLYSYRDFLISMFALFFSLYGLTIATQNAVDRDKAKRAAARIFELTDRQSLIDPLGNEGKQEV